MIRIPRTNPAPARLKENGSRQTKQDCVAYDQSPQDYNSGTKSFPDRDYYRTEEVKGILVEMHRGKCCYCEKRLESRELQVEHFRPKGAVRQLPGDANERPGYFWLAYSWDNLFLACAACNGKKSTTFPLEDPGQRARSCHDEVACEEAELVNPSEDDPRDHIYFMDEVPCHWTQKGWRTIEVLDLRRNDLHDLRFTYIQMVKQLRIILDYSLIDNQTDRLQEVAGTLRDSMREGAKYSSMVIDLFKPGDPLLEVIQQSGD